MVKGRRKKREGKELLGKGGRKEEKEEEEGWDNDRHCHAARGGRVYLRSGHAAASRKGSGGRAGGWAGGRAVVRRDTPTPAAAELGRR